MQMVLMTRGIPELASCLIQLLDGRITSFSTIIIWRFSSFRLSFRQVHLPDQLRILLPAQATMPIVQIQVVLRLQAALVYGLMGYTLAMVRQAPYRRWLLNTVPFLTKSTMALMGRHLTETSRPTHPYWGQLETHIRERSGTWSPAMGRLSYM